MFCAPVHMDGALVLEVLDTEWCADSLPLDDVEVPASAVAPLDDDDVAGTPAPETDASAPDNRWTDLALDSFSAE